MRFIHISDVMLGAVPDADQVWGQTRARELWDSFKRVIDDCNRERVDLLLISGNLFARQPIKREIDELNKHLDRLERTQVVITAGSLDYIRDGSLYAHNAWADHVHFVESSTVQCVDIGFLGVKAWGLSSDRPVIRERLFEDVVASSGDDYDILLISGMDEEHCPADRRMLSTAGFDYVGIGRAGQADIREREKNAICGSLEPVNSDDDGRHGYVLGEIIDGRTTLSLVPIAKREYKDIDLKVDRGEDAADVSRRLRDMISLNGNNNIYTVYVSGQVTDVDALLEELKRCGNVIKVTFEDALSADIDRMKASHQGDIIERFITLLENDEDEHASEALGVGLMALGENNTRK